MNGVVMGDKRLECLPQQRSYGQRTGRPRPMDLAGSQGR